MAAHDKNKEQARHHSDTSSFARRVWITIAIVTVVFVALFVLWNAANIILVLFAGALLAPALMVAGKVVVKKLYVEDVLGDHSVTYITDERDDG